MGLLIPQIEWLAHQIIKSQARGSVLQIGRIDFFMTEPEFEDLLVSLKLADKPGPGRFALLDPRASELYQQSIAANQHENRTFSNPRFTARKMISDHLFFSAFGFEKICSIDIDVSRDESTFRHDFNCPGILDAIGDPFDLVVDGGLMEHVFDTRTALLNITDAAKSDGGVVIHILPGNNSYDHGFYQFSPTLFKDYYDANHYDILTLQIMELRNNVYALPDTPFDQRFDTHRFFDYDPWLMAKCSFGKLYGGVYINFACVRKRADSLRNVPPHQYLFTPNARYISPWKE